MPGADIRCHPTYHSARSPVPVWPRRSPAARGTRPGHGALDRPDDASRPPLALRTRGGSAHTDLTRTGARRVPRATNGCDGDAPAPVLCTAGCAGVTASLAGP